ncbi:AsmA-like C-terminal region-containing protein, partial [Rickettsiales bacterium]|nr:AsmA-like C-terminal region-containing protein [Rickettsiales bacterium]
SFMEGFIYPIKKPVLFEGSLNSEIIDFEEFVKIKNKFSYLNNQSSVYRVSEKNNNLFPISLKVNTDIKKLKYNNHLLENIKYKLLLGDETLKIENFKANYLNISIILNAVYNLDSRMTKGLLLINNFEIPREMFGKTKYDIFGGNGNLTAKFKSNFKNESLQKIIDNTDIEGKFFSRDSTFKGIDTKKIAKKIDSLKQISDFFSLINLFDTEGLSVINEINGDFLFNKGVLKLRDVLIINENFKITSSGNYTFSENYFDLRNTIKLKTNEYTKLPNFQITLSGTPEKYSTKLDMEEIKKFFLTDEILKLGPIKSLKIPMKKNNSIDLEEIFKLF